MKLTEADRISLITEIDTVAKCFDYTKTLAYLDDDCKAALVQINIARKASDRLTLKVVGLSTKLLNLSLPKPAQKLWTSQSTTNSKTPSTPQPDLGLSWPSPGCSGAKM